MHSLTKPCRIHHPQGFYDEDWIEDQQAEEDYQKPDKFQKIANMVSLNGVPGILRFNTMGVDVVNMTYIDMCGTTSKI